MKRVAQHLEIHAKKLKAEEERDKFARSSFNRYYYATFLVVREMLIQIDPKWSEPSHASLPEILRSALRKKFNRQLEQGVLPTGESKHLRSAVSTAASGLASLLEEGTGTRVVADYQPEKPVSYDGKVLELNGVKSSRAANWPNEANRNCAIILKAGKRLGLC